MENLVKELMDVYEYVTCRSGIENVKFIANYAALSFQYTQSKWGSETNVWVELKRSNAGFNATVTVIGTTLIERLDGHQALQDLIEEVPDEDAPKWGAPYFKLTVTDTLTWEEVKECFAYSPEDIRAVGLIQERLAEIPDAIDKYDMYQKGKGRYKFVLYPHICPQCGKERRGECWYNDQDGVVLHPDIYKRSFHVTCDGDVQLR